MPSSSPSSSQQSLLYQYYTPIPLNELAPSTPTRVLQPSTTNNISSRRSRINVKRPIQPKDSTVNTTSSNKRPKQSKIESITTPTNDIDDMRPFNRQAPETIPRILLARTLHGRRDQLSKLTCLEEAKHYFSRPIDSHQVLGEDGQGTFPFAVQCCHTNSLAAVSDESGHIRLLDTSSSQETAITTEHIRMTCHDNAIFDISWSSDDMKLATASGDQTGKVFDIMSRKCIALFTGYHKTTLKKVVFKPEDRNILTTSSRDGSVFVWDLRCTGIQSSPGPPRYKPTASILGGHPISRTKKANDIMQGSAVTGLTWSEGEIITACDANSVIKIWDPRKLNALSSKTPMPIETSRQPDTHVHRQYGITSIGTQNNYLFALSKDSRLYAYSLGSLSYGPMHIFSHPRLRCDSFWIKIAVKNDLIAMGSTDEVVLLVASNPRFWERGGVVLKGGHTREVSDVSFTFEGGDLCTVGDDMVVRVWRDGTGVLRDVEREKGCGWGWAET